MMRGPIAITTDLEDTIREEIKSLENQVKVAPGMHATQEQVFYQGKVSALKWLLERAGLVA
jgi:hypothetical protein